MEESRGCYFLFLFHLLTLFWPFSRSLKKYSFSFTFFLLDLVFGLLFFFSLVWFGSISSLGLVLLGRDRSYQQIS